MIIGAGFYNTPEDSSKNPYISIVLDDVLKEKFPDLAKISFSLNEIPPQEQKENGPSWRLSAYVPKKKEN